MTPLRRQRQMCIRDSSHTTWYISPRYHRTLIAISVPYSGCVTALQSFNTMDIFSIGLVIYFTLLYTLYSPQLIFLIHKLLPKSYCNACLADCFREVCPFYHYIDILHPYTLDWHNYCNGTTENQSRTSTRALATSLARLLGTIPGIPSGTLPLLQLLYASCSSTHTEGNSSATIV